MKMANGTNLALGYHRRFPGTRAKSAALVREQYVKAEEYRDKIRKAAGDASKMPPRDLNMEGLVEVLDGKRVVQFHTHRHDDILTVLRLANEFHFKVVLHHVSDAWMVAGQIADAHVPVSLILIDSPGGKLEAKDVSFASAAVLEKAGVLVGFRTPTTPSRIRASCSAWPQPRRPRRHVARKSPLWFDYGERPNSRVAGPHWFARAGKRRRLHPALGRPALVSIWHHVMENLGGGRKSLRPLRSQGLSLRRGRLRRQP